MNRLHTTIRRLSDPDDDFVPGNMAERMAMVWPLTVEAASLSQRYDAERPMQRHITRLIRRKSWTTPADTTAPDSTTGP